MNIALEQAKEYVDGKLRRSYGDAFVRGNNGEYLSNVLGFSKGLNDGTDGFITVMYISADQ